MADGGAKVSDKLGYVVRDGQALRLVEMSDKWAAPARAYVDIPTDPKLAPLAADIIFAWIAVPALTEKGNKDRLAIMEATQAWRWRSAAHFGALHKRDIPDVVKAIKTDKMWRRMEKLRLTMAKRFLTCEAFLSQLVWVGVADDSANRVRYSGPGSILEIALHMAARQKSGDPDEDDKVIADNIRNRMWQKVRPIIHLAEALRMHCVKSGNDLPAALGNPTWISSVLEGAESRRSYILPALKHSVSVETTIQFRPRP